MQEYKKRKNDVGIFVPRNVKVRITMISSYVASHSEDAELPRCVRSSPEAIVKCSIVILSPLLLDPGIASSLRDVMRPAHFLNRVVRPV